MERLDRTYEEDGKHAQFLRRTLDASLGEAATRHYGGFQSLQIAFQLFYHGGFLQKLLFRKTVQVPARLGEPERP